MVERTLSSSLEMSLVLKLRQRYTFLRRRERESEKRCIFLSELAIYEDCVDLLEFQGGAAELQDTESRVDVVYAPAVKDSFVHFFGCHPGVLIVINGVFGDVGDVEEDERVGRVGEV